MSFPLTRRFAQAALLVAAGATPLLVAGSASAADLVPTHDLGAGLTQLDSTHAGPALQGAAHELGKATGSLAGDAVASGVPTAADTAGATLATGLPAAGRTAGTLAEEAGSTTSTTGTLANGAGQKLAPVLPVSSSVLPVGQSSRALPSMPSAPSVTGISELAGTLPVAGLTHGLPAADGLTGALPLDQATGHASDSAAMGSQRLGGGLPGLGSNNSSPLSGLTGLGGGSSPLDTLTQSLGGGSLPLGG